eukprot:TRINITY_DN36864_c0_g1_i1.p1 TRINITY_DN36864_c0_g1~~TRINITY_DN36864_c0_g1_i1.p1  ORF type:complete len:330 (+),score=96.79 TRINITY_DN36864_c0_g1_i1:61-1050(+)
MTMAMSQEDMEKKVKAIEKKLKQIEGLKAKPQLDAEARKKVESEQALRDEVADLTSKMKQLQVQEQKPAPAGGGAPSAQAEAGAEGGAPSTQAEAGRGVESDPHSSARAKALEPAPEGLALLGAEAEKTFKNNQKKLRDIEKLHAKDKLDKLQLEKMETELTCITQIEEVRRKAAEAQQPSQAPDEQRQNAAPTVHLEDAIVKKLIEERRAKYLGVAKPWDDEFCGLYRVHPPEGSNVAGNFKKIVQFEYFLWADFWKPKFQDLKDTIARTVEVDTAKFSFETFRGKKLKKDDDMISTLQTLERAREASESILGKPLIDIRIIVNTKHS